MELLSPTGLNHLLNARQVAVLTGAGVSAESGVPTFRGEEGLWKKFRPEELANFDAFMSNPKLVWEWYTFRIQSGTLRPGKAGVANSRIFDDHTECRWASPPSR